MRNTLIAFSLLVIVIMISGAGYFAGIIGAKSDYKKREQRIIDSLSIINNIQSEKYKRESDSLKNFYAGIDKANERTNKAINKIFKQTDEKIKHVYSLNDSLKRILADSILKANGFK